MSNREVGYTEETVDSDEKIFGYFPVKKNFVESIKIQEKFSLGTTKIRLGQKQTFIGWKITKCFVDSNSILVSYKKNFFSDSLISKPSHNMMEKITVREQF